jgi:hypothetical protein
MALISIEKWTAWTSPTPCAGRREGAEVKSPPSLAWASLLPPQFARLPRQRLTGLDKVSLLSSALISMPDINLVSAWLGASYPDSHV